jgi:hypothetical protein
MAPLEIDLSVREHRPPSGTRQRAHVFALAVTLTASIGLAGPAGAQTPAGAAPSGRSAAPSGPGAALSRPGTALSGLGAALSRLGNASPAAKRRPAPTCESSPPPAVGPARGFRHRRSRVVAGLGHNHRGRDILLRPGDRQVAIAKFAYGLIDKDLVDEEVEVFLLRSCSGAWQRLGTAVTTDDGDHVDEEGVADSGGRIYFEIPPAAALEPGRHRLHLSVAGDRSSTDLIIHVAPAGAPVFIADIDGTLTRSGTEEFRALLSGRPSEAHPDAADALQALAARGYIPIYLSGRPEPLVGRTRDFLARSGFPPGLVMTTAKKSGAIGGAAARFKTATLARTVRGRGYVPAYAFGDTPTDATAYASARIGTRLFYRYADAEHGGRRFDLYRALVTDLANAPLVGNR